MQLYFSPLSCSIAARIAFYEAGEDATFIEVDRKTKLTRDGKNFRDIHPLGLVPTLRTDDGDILTENAALLQYVADFFPKAKLAPTDRMERARLHEWLCFIGTELHKALFAPLLDTKAPEGAKAYALEKGASRLSHLETYLTGREFLLERFSVADAYLFTVLNWSVVTPVDLKKWPAICAYVARLRDRPSVAKAFAEERALYTEEQARHKASA
ncbi:glutathione S-transferase [Cystobacter fuscus]|uniref:Glutathione S-transferase n=1 Tax=Cystobacter fuscus TaxID=43 RepID=A0A250JCI3_9BACT|nr:glutathione binding-like protein [Cystobacter fuscus]ATB41619.1 glutathione S-transferase [Cystobacter fuscus]